MDSALAVVDVADEDVDSSLLDDEDVALELAWLLVLVAECALMPLQM